MTLPTGQFQQDLIKPVVAEQAWLWACRIAIPSSSTVNYVGNTENIVYDGTTHSKMNLEVGMQQLISDGSIPTVTLKVTSINNTLYDLIQETEGAVGSDVKLIKINSDYIDSSVSALEVDYELLSSQADEEWMYFTLGIPNPMNQRFPLRDYSSSICPWATPYLFKSVRCGYAGADTGCTGTLEDCITKGNQTNWGGFVGLDPAEMTL